MTALEELFLNNKLFRGEWPFRACAETKLRLLFHSKDDVRMAADFFAVLPYVTDPLSRT